MLYTYQATDATGNLIKGSMEARDENTLVDKIREMGYYPISVGRAAGEKNALRRFSLPLFSRAVSGSDVLRLTHELSSLLEAGLPLDRALSVLAELESKDEFKQVLRDLLKGIQGGASLADCLGRHRGVFSDVYVSTVKAGEAGGSLEAVLERLGRFMDQTQKLKDDITSALLYPLLLTVVGGSAVLVMIFFVIPKFSIIFEDMGGVMPLPTRMLLFLSEGLLSYWWLGLIFFAGVFLELRRRTRTEEGKFSIDRAKFRVPVLGPVLRKAAVSRFARTLGTLMQGGLPILDALSIAVSTMGSPFMARSIAPVIEGVRRGRGMALPLKEAGSFPPLAVQMLTVGEETGRLDDMLIKLADNYDREIATAIKRGLALLEPAIILLMAIVVGFIVISLLLAIFSINDMPM